MIIGTIKQTLNTISINLTDKPYENSAGLQLETSFDGTFSGYAIGFMCAYTDSNGTKKTIELDYADSIVTLPVDVFAREGHIYVSMYATLNSVIVTTNMYDILVTDSNSLTATNNPTETDDWRALATNLVNNFLTNGAIKTSNLQDGCVTTVKIADGAVTNAKIADSSITTSKIKDAAVSSSKIADGSITLAKLADEAIIKQKTVTGINVGTYAFLEGYEYIVDSTSTNVPLTGVSYIIRKIGTMVVAIMTSGSYIGWTFFATYGSITSASSWTSPFIVQ